MKVVGTAACTVGIAHTYITQEKLESAAKKAGYDAQIETQGTIGIESELTQQQIDDAGIVISAINIKIVDMECFKDKKALKVPIEIAVKSPDKLIRKVVEITKK